jgi:diaminopimelate epimerase
MRLISNTFDILASLNFFAILSGSTRKASKSTKMKISFTKMTGAGNDFVVIDNRSKKIKNGAKAARTLCDRRWGIGADGLLLIEKSRSASYRMMYYNADGSYGGMCGNGGRCIAYYAVSHKLAPGKHTFEALGYIYSVDVRKSEVVLTLKDPQDLQINNKLVLGSKIISINSVDTGSPHAVIPIGNLNDFGCSLEDLNVQEVGREIRYHDDFKANGTNVNFIEKKKDNSLAIRTYERGVESETLACGTGSVASALVAARLWNLRSPINVIPKSGHALRVEFDEMGDRLSNIRLAGPAKVVFQGVIEV